MMRFGPLSLLLSTLVACENPPAEATDASDDMTAEMEARRDKLVRHPRPPTALINAIEEKVSRDPCVGGLNRWERLYTFDLDDKHKVDENKINIDFRQAGVHGFRAGVRVGYPLEGIGNDDRRYNLVWGKFDRRTGALRIIFCGPNVP